MCVGIKVLIKVVSEIYQNQKGHLRFLYLAPNEVRMREKHQIYRYI